MHASASASYWDSWSLQPLNRLSLTPISTSTSLVEPSLSWVESQRTNETSVLIADENPDTDQNISPRRWSRSAFRDWVRRTVVRSGPAANATSTEKKRSWRNPFPNHTGWRMGVVLCCIAVAVCLVIELTLLISALSVSVGGFGSGLLYRGSCDKVKNMTVWLLLPLNIAATVLISTSNYVMQVMAAPDRKEVDYAHSLATSITIGGMRFRNLKFGGPYRRFIWWVLGLSSLPIHVLLNSAIYGALQASDSGILILSEDFQADDAWQQCNSTSSGGIQTVEFACSLMQNFNAGKTVSLTPQQCLHQYANAFQANASSAIVVTRPSAARYFSLPEPGPLGTVPASLGIACELQAGSESDYVEIPLSHRQYELDFDALSGSATASIPFLIGCTNDTTEPSEDTSWTLNPGDTGPTLYSTTSALFMTEDSPLMNISSVRSAFSAFEYRYWANARFLDYDFDSPDLAIAEVWDPRSWLCPKPAPAAGEECDPTQMDVEHNEWLITSSTIPVIGCHVLPTPERCTLQYSSSILVIALVADVVKLTTMLIVLRLTVEPLATIGDAIESFLSIPDAYTKDLCLLDADTARRWGEVAAPHVRAAKLSIALAQDPGYQKWLAKQSVKQAIPDSPHTALRATGEQADKRPGFVNNTSEPFVSSHLPFDEIWLWSQHIPAPSPGAWVPIRKRWYVVPSKSRWFYFVCFFITLAVPTSLIFVYGLKALRRQRIANIWTVGLNGPDPNALVTGGMLDANNIIRTAIVINMPHLLFSMLYFLFNAAITMMHTAHEWSAFATQRKALRVSKPEGQQRSTYWLQLPLRYSVPLMVASGTLHWLLGRSIYVVKVDVYGFFGDREPSKDFFACGYSPLTILGLVIVLGIMLLASVTLSLRRLGSGTPLVKLNSLAIAAACHGDSDEEGLVTRPLMWGVLRNKNDAETQHCSFSSREVSPLVEGVVYC